MEKEKLVSLVTKAQSGDNEALNSLFNEFYNDLYYFSLKTVKDDEIALDVTQEAFVEIINTLGNLKEPAAFVTWAKQITYHQCTRYFKKKKDVLVEEDEDGNTVFDTLQEDKSEFIPDEALDKSDFKKTILAILDELSEEQRSATMMYYFDEMSVKQIAEIQGVSEGTIKSRLNYARKAIKNSVEEYEKKNGIKLHAVPFFSLFKWLFASSFESGLPLSSAKIVAEGVCAATGTTITVATATATTGAAITTSAAAVGLGAKLIALPLVTKVVACVVAGVIAVSATTAAVVISKNNNNNKNDQKNKTQATDSQIDYSYRTEYMSSWNHEQALEYYNDWLTEFDMPYFNSVDELSVDVAVRFGYSEWAGTYQGKWHMDSIVGDQKALLKALFGRDFDFTKLTGEYATYNAENGIVTVNKETTNIYTNGYGERNKPIDNGDGTYSIIIRAYRNKVDTLPNDIKDGEYVNDDENGGYLLLTHSGILTIEKKDGFWVLKSYTEAEKTTEIPNSAPTNDETSSSEKVDPKIESLKKFGDSFKDVIRLAHLPTFNNTSELTADDVTRILHLYSDFPAFTPIPIKDIDNWSKQLLNNTYDFTKFENNNVASYDSTTNTITIEGGIGNPDAVILRDYKDNNNGTYSLYYDYGYIGEDSSIKRGTLGTENIDWFKKSNDILTLQRKYTLTVKNVDNNWQIVSLSNYSTAKIYRVFDTEWLRTIYIYGDGTIDIGRIQYATYSYEEATNTRNEAYAKLKQEIHSGILYHVYGVNPTMPVSALFNNEALKYTDLDGKRYITYDLQCGDGSFSSYKINSDGSYTVTGDDFISKINKSGDTLYVTLNGKNYRLVPITENEEFIPHKEADWIF